MDQESKEILEKLRQQASASRNLCNLASFSGIAVIPLAFIGIAAGNATLAAASLAWLVSHYAGYITRMIQEEKDRDALRLSMMEAGLSAKASSTGPSTYRVTLN